MVGEPVKLLSHAWLFVIPRIVAYEAHPSMKFSRQEYWHGLLFPSPGDLPDAGIEPRSLTLQADALPSEPPGKLPSVQRPEFSSWVWKIPCRREWLPTSVFLPGEFHGLQSMGCKESDTTEWLSLTRNIIAKSRLSWEKLNIQKTKIMASGPTTSWQIDGETMETVTDFIFLGSRITADSYYSHEIKRHCSLEEKLWPT